MKIKEATDAIKRINGHLDGIYSTMRPLFWLGVSLIFFVYGCFNVIGYFLYEEYARGIMVANYANVSDICIKFQVLLLGMFLVCILAPVALEVALEMVRRRLNEVQE